MILVFIGELSMPFESFKPFILDGWNPAGMLGHMFLHAGFWHLIGNMIFLWVFGNAICGLFNNILYVPLFLILGMIAAVSHLIVGGGPMVGASGAINGVVGAFLVLYPFNNISCFIWFIVPRTFSISSIWMILLWFGFDILGAYQGGGGIAYVAHIGGFIGGVAAAVIALKTNLIQPHSADMSLLKYFDQKFGISKRREQKLEEPDFLESITAPPAAKKTVPPKEEVIDLPDDKIPVACTCGARLRIPSKYAGKKARCPKCKTIVPVPME
jgi:membrane associated rhomboid family serine protease